MNTLNQSIYIQRLNLSFLDFHLANNAKIITFISSTLSGKKAPRKGERSE